MSGLEVFALVASIFQVISFAGQTIELCKTVYDGGLPDKRLGDKAAAMYDLSIKVLYQCQATPGAQSDPERELTAFATKCREMARELKESVDRFDRPQAKGKLLPSMVTTFGYQLQKRSLKRLEKDLESHRQMLETKLLARVCSRAQATEILLWENFHTLDERVRHFVKRYADGHTRLQDLIMEESLRLERALSAHVTKETSNSTQSILAEMRKGLEDLSARMPGTAEEEAPRRKRFLESVKYSRMDARQNQVRESHSGTFSWMLAGRDLSSQEWEAGIQDSSRAKLFGTKDNKTKRKDLLDEDPYFSRDDVRREKRWDDFRDWLKSASNLYWISGKPGSGKSTLVKFLVESPFTQEALDISKPATRIISHFFWKPGTEMQNSRKGLLCSLLYQLISSDPALLPPLLERNPSLESNTYYTDWSVEDLSSACFAAFELHPSAVCVFIDGLDEAREADIPDVLRTVDRMSTTPKVKVCVSSRPEQRFLQLVQSNKGLRLEDLTLGDMRRYARHHLNPFLKSSSVFSNTQHSIPEELARKAQGVFLWLYLATQCLVRGLDNRDHQEEELAKRLSVLPTELEDLYNDMWLRLNEDGETDRQSTALFFNLILDARALGQRVPGRGDDWGDSLVEDGKVDLIHFMGATQPALQNAVLDERQTIPASHVDSLCVQTRRDIHVRCAGFVELLPTTSGNGRNPPIHYGPVGSWEEGGLLQQHDQQVPHFIHRTAHDFLVDTEEGRKILAYDSSSASDRAEQLLRGSLVKARFCGRGDYQPAFDALVLLHGITNPERQQKVFEFCWKWYDLVDPYPWVELGWKPQAHFFSLAANFPRLRACVRSAILGHSNPSLMATTLLQDLIRNPWCTHREYMTDKANTIERLEFALSLGANPRRKGFFRPPPNWYRTEPVPHSIEFATTLDYYIPRAFDDIDSTFDIFHLLFPAYAPGRIFPAYAQGRRDPNEHYPILVTAVQESGPRWSINHYWGMDEFNKENPELPRLCEFVLEVNTQFSARFFEADFRKQVRFENAEYKRRVREGKSVVPLVMAWQRFIYKLHANFQDQWSPCKPSVRVVAVSIPSLGRAGDGGPRTFLIRNKSISSRLAAVIQLALFDLEKSNAVGWKIVMQHLPRISREIRRGSKDYEPLTVPITDYLAEIDCGYCFVDKEYQRVVKREDGSMVRVVPEDWDKEAREAQGELVPSLWFGVVLRIFEMLLWVSAWFWRLGVPSTKRKRLGGQEVS